MLFTGRYSYRNDISSYFLETYYTVKNKENIRGNLEFDEVVIEDMSLKMLDNDYFKYVTTNAQILFLLNDESIRKVGDKIVINPLKTILVHLGYF